MSADERAHLFRQLPESVTAKLLAAIPKEDAREVTAILAWPEGTVGALMTTEFVGLPAELTVEPAIARIREVAARVETIYYAAISPEARGASPAARARHGDRTTADVMGSDRIVAVQASADQEEAARTIAKYDLLALPVVDPEGVLLGIITVDDVSASSGGGDRRSAEDGRDRAARGLVPLELPARRPLARGLARSALRRRLLHLEHAARLRRRDRGPPAAGRLHPADHLVGRQHGEPVRRPAHPRDGARRGRPEAGLAGARPELATGLLLGAVLALIGFVYAGWGIGVDWRVAAVVGAAVMSVVLFGALTGAVMPLLIRRLGLDPAVASAPMIATVSDVAGIVIYLSVAQALLGLH
jgi:magnesium transporter